MGRPKAVLKLTDDERGVLQRLVRRRSGSAASAIRAKIVLRCATGAENQHVAEELGVSQAMVGKWRKRFVEQRLDGLLDEPRVGRPRTVTDADVERIVDVTLHEKPRGCTHWSSRKLAKELGVSPNNVAPRDSGGWSGSRARATSGHRHASGFKSVKLSWLWFLTRSSHDRLRGSGLPGSRSAYNRFPDVRETSWAQSPDPASG